MIFINLDSVNIVAKYLERNGKGMVEKVCLLVKHVTLVACLQKQQVQEVGPLWGWQVLESIKDTTHKALDGTNIKREINFKNEC